MGAWGVDNSGDPRGKVQNVQHGWPYIHVVYIPGKKHVQVRPTGGKVASRLFEAAIVNTSSIFLLASYNFELVACLQPCSNKRVPSDKQ